MGWESPQFNLGNVCLLLCQFQLFELSILALGANVIAACGSQDKLDVAKKYGGADYGVNYSNPGWQKEVLKITNGKGGWSNTQAMF